MCVTVCDDSITYILPLSFFNSLNPPFFPPPSISLPLSLLFSLKYICRTFTSLSLFLLHSLSLALSLSRVYILSPSLLQILAAWIGKKRIPTMDNTRSHFHVSSHAQVHVLVCVCGLNISGMLLCMCARCLWVCVSNTVTYFILGYSPCFYIAH